MSLPYRKTKKCGERYVDGELTIDLNNGCGQDIYQSNTEKFKSGKYMILNLRDGVGGYKDMKHVCPNRVGSKFHHFERVNMRRYDYHQQHKMCITCAQYYNSEKMLLCPNCFKMICRKCSNEQNWVAGKGSLCFQCGARCDAVKVYSASERLYGRMIE